MLKVLKTDVSHPFAAALMPRAAVRPALRQGSAFLAGFLGGWAVLYGALMPFGLGLTLGFAEDCFAAGAAGALLGLLLHGFGALSLDSLCLLCAVGAAVAARWLWPGRFRPAALAGCGALGLGAVCFAFGPTGGGVDLLLTCGADALLAAALGFALRRFPPETPGVGMLLVAAGAAAALGSVSLGLLCLGVAVCAAVELALCCRGQPTAALAYCAVTGAALCAADPSLGPAVAGLSCASAAGALLAPGRRIEAFAAYAGGCVAGVLCVQPPGNAFSLLLSAGAGLAAAALLPKDWLAPVPAAEAAAPEERPRFSAAATRLEAVAESLSSLAETVNEVYDALPHRCESFRWVIDNTHDSLCFNCGRRECCWKQEYAATLDGMNALRPILEQNGHLETSDLPGALSRCIHPAALCAAANKSFALYRSRKEARVHAEAMRTALTEQYSAVADALGVLSEQLGRPGSPEPYKSGRVADFFSSLGTPPLECAVSLDDLGRTRAAVTLPRTRFAAAELSALAQEVGRLCRRTFEPPQVLSCKGMTTLLFFPKSPRCGPFRLCGQRRAGTISGDAVQQFCSPAAAQMILCDGMGTGRPAAVDGNLAAELTARLLKAGFTAELAARLVNVALALKSDEESGATLDLISVDLYTGTARLFKAGAAPGFRPRRAGAARGGRQPPHRHSGRGKRPEPGGAPRRRGLCGARVGWPPRGRHRLGAQAAGTLRCRCRPARTTGQNAGRNCPHPRRSNGPPRRYHRRRPAAGKLWALICS